jgi:hypothetical protein
MFDLKAHTAEKVGSNLEEAENEEGAIHKIARPL